MSIGGQLSTLPEEAFQIWQDYLVSMEAWGERRFLVSPQDIREGCHPFRLVHGSDRPRDAVVLFHGLSDSPWFMRAIATELHVQAGLDVYVPLFQGHGLKHPRCMRDVQAEVWLRNAAWTVKTARQTSRRVSVGGLSTGGAIAVLLAFRDQDGEDLVSGRPRSAARAKHQPAAAGPESLINGGVLLFSAAIRLQQRWRFKGHTLETLLRSPIGSILDILIETYAKPDQGSDLLIGDNPYRYARMDIGGAAELAKIIAALDRKRRPRLWGELRGLKQPLFIAHSEADDTADIRALRNLWQISHKGHALPNVFFRIGRSFQVPHASMVLAHHLRGHSGSPMEPANPFFVSMMTAALRSGVINNSPTSDVTGHE